MFEHYFRSYYQQALVDPIASLLVRHTKLQPKHITFAAGLTGVLSALSIAFHLSVLAVILLLISGYLDTLDGTLARLTKKNTLNGAILDIMTDRFVEFSIVAGLYFYAPSLRATACIWLLGSILMCVSSFLLAAIYKEKPETKEFYYSPGLIERAEAFLFFALMIIFPHYFNWIAWLFGALVFYTAFKRTHEIVKHKIN